MVVMTTQTALYCATGCACLGWSLAFVGVTSDGWIHKACETCGGRGLAYNTYEQTQYVQSGQQQHKGTQAITYLGLILGVFGMAVIIIPSMIGSNVLLSKFPILKELKPRITWMPIAGGAVMAFAGILEIAGTWIFRHVEKPKNLDLGYSFDLTQFGGFFMIAGGILVMYYAWKLLKVQIEEQRQIEEDQKTEVWCG